MAKILFFGKLGDVAGGPERNVSLPEGADSVSALISALAAEDAVLGEALKAISVRVMVNGEIAHEDMRLIDEDEIAFLPPVSGG